MVSTLATDRTSRPGSMQLAFLLRSMQYWPQTVLNRHRSQVLGLPDRHHAQQPVCTCGYLWCYDTEDHFASSGTIAVGIVVNMSRLHDSVRFDWTFELVCLAALVSSSFTTRFKTLRRQARQANVQATYVVQYQPVCATMLLCVQTLIMLTIAWFGSAAHCSGAGPVRRHTEPVLLSCGNSR